MKKLLLLFTVLAAPQLFAVSNLKLNNQKSLTINSLPTTVTLTADLSTPGAEMEVKTFMDANNSGTLDEADILVDFFVLTDGIGWIRNSQDPDEDIEGDETPVDGKIKTTAVMAPEEGFAADITIIMQAREKNGSSDTAVLSFKLQPTPPYIKGKVTDFTTGSPLPMIMVFTESGEKAGAAITDEQGNYFINLVPGTWKIVAADMLTGQYAPSDTMTVILGANSEVTQDFALKGYTTFIQGSVKKEDGTGVEGITLYAINITAESFSFGHTDANGNVKVGVLPGTIAFGPLPFGADLPEGFYLDPPADTLTIAEGETKTSNFTLKEYTAFITGTCTANGAPLAGVEITAMKIDFLSGTFEISTTLSKEDGTYKVGVSAGTIMLLNASKPGYQVTQPMIGYQNIIVGQGQTVTGKDFVLSPTGDVMSLSGRVTFANGNPAPNVYVVAINDMYDGREGFLITYTDGNGDYSFDGIEYGTWKVGVFKANYSSNPEMRFEDMYGFSISNADFVLSSGTFVETRTDLQPGSFSLTQNYPNPFRLNAGYSATTFQLQLDKPENIEVSIYNVNGQLVATLFAGRIQPGVHSFNWDGRSAGGGFVPAGSYFYRVRAGNQQLFKQMMIVH